MKDQNYKTKGGNFKMMKNELDLQGLKDIKIDGRKGYYITLDVETAGGLDEKIVYDLGFAIHDKKGNIYYSRSLIIDEIFNDTKLMNTAYYSTKVPIYKKNIAKGKHEVVSFLQAREIVLEAIAHFKPKFVMAYNLNFDMDALSKTAKRLLGLNKFLDSRAKGIVPKDIWSFACEVLFSQKSYAKFAYENKLYSKAGNYKTSAEVAYAYMINDGSFVEEHTGLEDVLIEVAIFARCSRQNKKHLSGILSNPWKLVTKKHGKVEAPKEND